MKEELAKRLYAIVCDHFGAKNQWREFDTETKEKLIRKFAKVMSEIGPPPPYPPDPPTPPPKP